MDKVFEVLNTALEMKDRDIAWWKDRAYKFEKELEALKEENKKLKEEVEFYKPIPKKEGEN
jgi:hypothetical protein